MEGDYNTSVSLLHLFLLLGFPLLALSHSIVTSLPGFPGPLPFHLETGYVGVGESEDVQLFYYFIKSERNPKEDPLMLWLTGGPGCSALSGLVYEIGPLHFNVVEYNGSLPTLALHPDSWTKVANIIFVDSPVGTGFSYSRSAEGSMTGDKKTCDQAYQFLRKWLLDHPEFLSNPVYVGGDSYSGLTVPLVMQDISDGNKAGTKPFINLRGYVLGNAATIPNHDQNKKVPYAYGMGLISDEIYESAKRSCGGEYVNVNPSNAQCVDNLQAYSKCVSGINLAHILEPLCTYASPKPKEMETYRRSLVGAKPLVPLKPQGPPPFPALGCRTYDYLFAYFWANDNRVRKALHVKEGSVPDWQRCNYGLPYQREVQSSFPYHVNLSARGYRSLVYSGDHDMLVPYLATEAWVRALNYSIVDDWRPWMIGGQVGGYTRAYSNNMTFATVKGGGHTAPEYKPKECYAMFKRWISNEPL